MAVQLQSAPLEGRMDFATTWTPPEWSAAADGSVLDRFVWAAIDCPSGWRAGSVGSEFRLAVTGEMRAEVYGPIQLGSTYALVAWAGDWRGRRVTAGTALFSEDRACLAASESMWVAV